MATTPRQVYNALTKAGFSTVQAIGIMANGIAESGLQAETRAIDSNGYYSDGFVQFNEKSYPDAAGLVTGNPSRDLAAQAGYLKTHVSGQALQGSTGGQVAGNFAQFFERCQGCQQGGAQYNQRVANAAVVAGWVRSGKWPKSAVNPTVGSGLSGSLPASSSGPGSDCAFGPKLPVVGQVCLVKRATIRHMVGGGLMVGGFLVMLPGFVIILAYGFRATGALQGAANVAAAVPGGGRYAEGLTVAHQRATRTGAGVTRERTQARARQRTAAERAGRQQAAAGRRAERQRAAGARRQAAEARRQERYERGTVTVEERTPIEGEMGGTRRTVTRRPGPRQ